MQRWISLLRSAAAPVLTGTPLAAGFAGDASQWARSFCDEQGHRRQIDSALLGVLLGTPVEQASGSIDIELWAKRARGEAVGEVRGTGPLAPELHQGPIEVWTEVELSALHALWCWRTNSAIRARCESAASWLLEHVQPDNATQHPWAVHVFASLAHDEAFPLSAEADQYAQTLLHGSMVRTGRPDRFSALILEHGARELERGE